MKAAFSQQHQVRYQNDNWILSHEHYSLFIQALFQTPWYTCNSVFRMKPWISTKLNQRLKCLFSLSFFSVYKGQHRWNQISATFQGLDAQLGRGSLALIHKAKWVHAFRMFLSAHFPLSRSFFFPLLLNAVTQRVKLKLCSLPVLPPSCRSFLGHFRMAIPQSDTCLHCHTWDP